MLLARITRLGLFAALAVTALVGQTARADYSFTYSSFDPPMGLPNDLAYGISANGTIAGAYIDNNGSTIHGYVLQNGVYSTVDYPGAVTSNTVTWLQGINNAGDYTGYYVDDVGHETDFIYHNGSYISPSVGVPGGTFTYYNNVNEAGLVAVVYDDAGGNVHGAVYNLSNQTFSLVPDVANGTAFYPQTVGPNGEILENYLGTDNVFHGALIKNGMTTILDFPGATATHADSLSSLGLIGGNYTDAVGAIHGFIYDLYATKWYSIDYPGSLETKLYLGNSPDTFVGYYLGQDGNFHSMSVRAVPEPSAFALMAIGLGAAGLLARRRVKANRQGRDDVRD